MNQSFSQRLWTVAILLASMTLVSLVTWFLPSLNATSTNILFRLRGELPVPDDLVIVAIDDPSLQRIGRWPWSRSVMAKALNKISAEHPRAVGLDVVYAEPSTETEDHQLVQAVANGHVVLPTQLIENENGTNHSGRVVWLPPFIQFAAAVGHVHASPDVDGVLRGIQLSKADDQGGRLWAFGMEVVRVAEAISPEDFTEKPGVLRVGPYEIPLRETEAASATTPNVESRRPNEMLINYAGPPGSFDRYSIADVLDGKVPSGAFANKIVLLGAVAPSMGDARVSPFMNYATTNGHGGQDMPGVEIHANVINTIRGRLWLRNVPEFYAFLISLGIILLVAVVVRRLDGWQQIASLGIIFVAILVGSFFAFKNFLFVPPLPGMLTGFAVAIPLLLNRALNVSRRLDVKLEALARTQKGFLLDDAGDAASVDQSAAWLELPRNLAGKVRAVDDVTTRLLARMKFMDSVFSGMGEGVLVCDASGRVVFANREAVDVFSAPAAEVMQGDFADLLARHGVLNKAELRAALSETSSGGIFHKEFAMTANGGQKHFDLNLSAITGGAESDGSGRESRVIGLVALITDTTRRVALDQMKMETLQLVSHELRTPLTSIQGLSDVLLKFPVKTVEAQEMLSTIHAEAVRLSETINHYLDIARLEAGAQPLRIVSINLAELIAACVSSHTSIAAERGITITQSLNPALPAVPADAQLLARALNNLLSNAIKYSPADSEVTVKTERDSHHIFISVCDEGPGIPIAERDCVFEKFYRLERDAASTIVGTGLGLSLVKEIVEKHGGVVRIEDPPRGGSVFTIELPMQGYE